jgi:hypothetical protein
LQIELKKSTVTSLKKAPLPTAADRQ